MLAGAGADPDMVGIDAATVTRLADEVASLTSG
jgi:hypothetical protein